VRYVIGFWLIVIFMLACLVAIVSINARTPMPHEVRATPAPADGTTTFHSDTLSPA